MNYTLRITVVCAAGITCGFFARHWFGAESSGATSDVNSVITNILKHSAASGHAGTTEPPLLAKLRAKVYATSGADLKAEDLRNDLLQALHEDPGTTMAFVFHEVPPELALELFPFLGRELAALGNKVIAGALSSVRTEKEMKAVWAAVLGPAFLQSPQTAVTLARLAPPLSAATHRLVEMAATTSGEQGILALVDGGADKSWFFPDPFSRHSGPEWLRSAKVSSAATLLSNMQQKFSGKWTEQDTLKFASVLPESALDTVEFLKGIVNGPLKTARPADIDRFVCDLAVTSPDGLRTVFDSLPEGFERQRLAQTALSLSDRDAHLRESIAKALPVSESASASRRPLITQIESKILIEPESGAAYGFALTADNEDRDLLIKHAAGFAMKARGPEGLLKSLAGIQGPALAAQVYAEAARLLIEARPEGLNEGEMQALHALNPTQIEMLRTALVDGHGERLIRDSR